MYVYITKKCEKKSFTTAYKTEQKHTYYVTSFLEDLMEGWDNKIFC